MSIRKKIVWLPYDFDTAIGINNEGKLVFDYSLEDTDQIDGKDIYDGLAQRSVIWNNIRDAFSKELAEMYRTLRSQGKLSYESVNRAFQDHQAKWPEAIFNEDSQFCYLDPLINDNTNYLEMLQGSKEEQRKWWLYNRFRYMDSKFNAGDALTDMIQVRSYAKSDITITPYADIYPAVKFGSYLVSKRGKRNVATLLECPVDALNDTETYIYSASQLASVGDLSGLKVGFADFSMATKLQSLKLGDSSASYDNPNLTTLTLGNNVLLQTIDVRNCSALGSGDMKVVDVTGCTGLRKAWFTGTKISGLTLPIGGVVDELALPATIANLTIRNQPKLATFSITGNSYNNVTTCRIENTPYFTSSETAINALIAGLPDSCRLRLVGLDINWLADTDEISDFYDSLERFRGLDISGGNLDDAYVEGVIHINSAKGSDIAALEARYPYLDIQAEHTESTLTYMNVDNTTIWQTETIYDGGNGTKTNTLTKTDSADGHYSYTANGWTTTPNGTRENDALDNIVADRTVYPAFIATVKTYTVRWLNADGTVLETDTQDWGTLPHYDGATPTYEGETATGWDRDLTTPITGNTNITATYKPQYTATFIKASADGGGTLYSYKVTEGQTPVYSGSTPTSSRGSAEDYPFEGWTPELAPIYANTTYTAKFGSPVEVAEIADSWDTIIANINNGTYKTVYKIGNYKPLDLGTEGTVNMQIVAFDTDDKADGTGKAEITWISKDLLLSTHNMNSTNTTAGGWENSAMRTYLKNTIKPLIPETVRNAIVPVTKVSSTYDGGVVVNGQTTTDDVWIPGNREIFNITTYESTGAVYSSIFDSATNRIKTRSGSASYWWLRSANGSAGFRYVSYYGDTGSGSASNSSGVALGFCI